MTEADAERIRRRSLVHHLSCVLFACVEVAGPGDAIPTEGTNGSGEEGHHPAAGQGMLASVPLACDVAGKTRRSIAAEELAELVAVDAKIKKATAELKSIVLGRGSHLMDHHGVGPVVAARVLADTGDIARFADRNRFASWTGTAPLDASSGEQNRHRLSRAGNRRMNHMIHIAAVTQVRLDTEGRAYYRRKRAEGKKPMEAMRCLKRRISDGIYRQLIADQQTPDAAECATGPGGHCGASQESSAVDLPPHIDTSDQPLPGPAPKTLPATKPHANPCAASAPRPSR